MVARIPRIASATKTAARRSLPDAGQIRSRNPFFLVGSGIVTGIFATLSVLFLLGFAPTEKTALPGPTPGEEELIVRVESPTEVYRPVQVSQQAPPGIENAGWNSESLDTIPVWKAPNQPAFMAGTDRPEPTFDGFVPTMVSGAEPVWPSTPPPVGLEPASTPSTSGKNLSEIYPPANHSVSERTPVTGWNDLAQQATLTAATATVTTPQETRPMKNETPRFADAPSPRGEFAATEDFYQRAYHGGNPPASNPVAAPAASGGFSGYRVGNSATASRNAWRPL